MPLVTTLLALSSSPPWRIVDVVGYDRIDTEGNSSLYNVRLPDATSYSSGPVKLLDLHGTRYEQGYATGRMVGKDTLGSYNALLDTLIKPGPVGALERAALEVVMDWQWSHALGKALPAEMVEEFRGFGAGCAASMPSRTRWCERVPGRLQVLANLPGDLPDLMYILLDELHPQSALEAEALLAEAAATASLGPGVVAAAVVGAATTGTHVSGGHQALASFLRRLPWSTLGCSMYAAWGSRTEGGRLLSGRNLDWNHDTGINAHKIVIVHHPPEPGRHAHATLGFAGLAGAVAGISAAGLTVHEANLESNRDSFRGFPWLMRLRHVMELASGLDGARRVWESTSNTVGFNHMVGSAADRKAVVIETNAKDSEYFEDDDPREATARFYGHDKSGPYNVTGAPLPNAVWRTNHGFAPQMVSHYMWNTTHAYKISNLRYHLIRDRLAAHAAAGREMGAADAVDLIAIPAEKGGVQASDESWDWAACKPPYLGGSNVLSVAYDPEELTAYAAWEDGGRGSATPTSNATAAWSPAACSGYVALKLGAWLNGSMAAAAA